MYKTNDKILSHLTTCLTIFKETRYIKHFYVEDAIFGQSGQCFTLKHNYKCKVSKHKPTVNRTHNEETNPRQTCRPLGNLPHITLLKENRAI